MSKENYGMKIKYAWSPPKINTRRSTPFRILYAPRINQDVYRPQAKVLVDRNERRYRRICHTMRYMPMSKSRTPMTHQTTTNITHTTMEVEWDKHGLHSRAAKDTKWTWFHMGHSGSTDKSSALYSSKSRLQRKQVSIAVHWQYPSIAWSTKPNHIR